MHRLLIVAAASGLLLATSAHAGDYNKAASAQAAADWSQDAASVAPQVSENQARNPQGPTLIASPPVPDTLRDRRLYGQPMSAAGRRTAPIGD